MGIMNFLRRKGKEQENRGKAEGAAVANRMMELKEELAGRRTGGRAEPRPRTDTPRQVIKERLNDRERLVRMEERGEIKLGSGKIPDDFWTLPMPEDPDGEVMRALLDERESSR